jgi:hypothetical protein
MTFFQKCNDISGKNGYIGGKVEVAPCMNSLVNSTKPSKIPS